jgi:hypothetical protein
VWKLKKQDKTEALNNRPLICAQLPISGGHWLVKENSRILFNLKLRSRIDARGRLGKGRLTLFKPPLLAKIEKSENSTKTCPQTNHLCAIQKQLGRIPDGWANDERDLRAIFAPDAAIKRRDIKLAKSQTAAAGVICPK